MSVDTWAVEKLRWRKSWTRQGKAQRTIEDYIAALDKYVQWCDEGGQVSTSLADAKAWLDHAPSQHVERQYVKALKAFGKWFAAEYEEPNPFEKLKLPPEPTPSASYTATATEDDLERLLASCGGTWWGIRDRAIILTLARTGLRRGEVANLMLDDVDLESQTIRVRKGKTDAAKRTIYMPDDVQGALLKYLKASAKRRTELATAPNPATRPLADQLFLSLQSNRYSEGALSQMLAKKGKKLGIDVRAHAFRRFFATSWLSKGGSETGLMRTAGWKSPAMIAHYTRANAERLAIEEARRLMA